MDFRQRVFTANDQERFSCLNAPEEGEEVPL
jgi:hypothetical protein